MPTFRVCDVNSRAFTSVRRMLLAAAVGALLAALVTSVMCRADSGVPAAGQALSIADGVSGLMMVQFLDNALHNKGIGQL